ncbi:MAG: hypothetical protein U9Q68_07730 [Euryarchaeota archaeon]|nr:hypothetical protein [Euryarchaeota archaeon]
MLIFTSSAALAASIFHFGRARFGEVKACLKDGGVHVRLQHRRDNGSRSVNTFGARAGSPGILRLISFTEEAAKVWGSLM